ncbi:MAG TPA: hypothetical protein ENF73_05415, partial [Proteobacteria bacterium]|nr:hypothetical protein [Pseudomonadota bacterium]
LALLVIPLYAAARLASAFAGSASELLGGAFFWLFAITSTSVVIAGFSSVLTDAGVLAALVIWLGASLLFRPDWKTALKLVRSVPRIDLVAATVVLWMLVLIVSAGWRYPPTPYDAYVYHLVFPARWLQAKSIFVVPTPFGDPASAYAPANGSAFYAYLMLLAGDDRLCRAGELIFWLISLAAIYRLCAVSGIGAIWRYAAVFAFGFSKEVLFQAGSSEVDLIVAACGIWAFLSLVRAIEGDTRWLWMFGLALGLGAGTKYVAAPLYLPLAVIAIFIWAKRNSRLLLCSLCLAAAIGGVWYLRNLMETGNPIFPVQLDMLGKTLFWGPITTGGMRESVFHIKSWDYKVASLLFLFGRGAWICFIWSALAGLVSALVMGPRWARVAAIWAIAGIVIHFELVPYNSQYRFLILFLALLWFAAASGLDRLPRAFKLVFAVPLALGILASLVGNPSTLELALPRLAVPMGGSGAIIPKAWLPSLAMLAWLVLIPALVRSRRYAFAALVVSCCVWLMVWVHIPSYRPIMRLGKTLFYEGDRASFYERIWRIPQPRRIAYTGHNSFYPLFAPDARHTAFYINAAGEPLWKYHDFAVQHRKSGLPIPPPADKPAIYRTQASRDVWLRNMRILKPDLVVVYKLSPFEERYIAHDEAGFPK